MPACRSSCRGSRRASRLAPFASSDELTGWRGVVADVAPFGLLLALMAALAPPSAVAVAALAVGLLLGTFVAGRPRAIARALAVTVGALAVAFLCLFPWSLTFVQPGARWSILSGAVGSPGTAGGVLRMLRFDVGPIGAGWLGWGILLGAAFVLLVARDVRLDWATRWWLAALAAVALAYAGSVGWLGSGGGATLALLAPAACCLAGAVGLGVAAFEVDVARSGFGWRQNLSAAAALCLLAGLLPSLVSSVDGRSALPSVGLEQILGWTGARSGPRGYEVLWLGDPASVPSPSWQVGRGLGFAVSTDGLPDGRRLWPSANPGVGTQVEAALIRAESGLTVRLGSDLALAGIRYVIMPTAAAPALPGVQVPPSVPPPPGLVQALQAQSDLRQLPTEGGVIAFENVDWPAPGAPAGNSVVPLAPAAVGTPASPRELGLAGGLLVVALAISEGFLRRRKRRRRGIPAMAGPDEVGTAVDPPPVPESEPVASTPS